MWDSAEMKYIIVESAGVPTAIIFDKTLNHADIAKGFNKVISAGMMNVYDDNGTIKVGCYGQSTTLKLKAREHEDSALIQRRLIYVP